MTRLYRVILPVADIERATRIYAELLGRCGERVSPGRHYFDCGGTILACYDPVADGDGDGAGNGWSHHPHQYLYFAVADLDHQLALARQVGCEIVEEGIRKMPWGERIFWARDPFGNPISFVDERTLFLGGESS